jgi:hypothetical protein
MRYALSLTAAAILALSLLACGGGEDGDGADGGSEADAGEDERAEAIAQCESLADLPDGPTAEAACCSSDFFTGEDLRPCTGEGFRVVTQFDFEVCAYRADELVSHPDGDYVLCASAPCEPCE